MDRTGRPTPEQIRLYRRRKRMLRKRRKRRRILLCVVLACAAAVGLLSAYLLGAFEKKSDVDLLTLKSDGTVVFEEVSDLSDAEGLRDFVKQEIEAYNDAHQDGDVRLARFERDGGSYYVRTEYKSIGVYSSFTGYDAYSGSASDAAAAGYGLSDVALREVSQAATGDAAIYTGGSGDAYEGMSLLAIKEWGLSVKVPGTVVAVSYASNVTCEAGSDTVEIAEQTDGGSAPVTYVLYR